MIRRRSDRQATALVGHIDGGARGNPGPAGYGVHVEASAPGDAGAAAPPIELFGYLGIAVLERKQKIDEDKAGPRGEAFEKWCQAVMSVRVAKPASGSPR